MDIDQPTAPDLADAHTAINRSLDQIVTIARRAVHARAVLARIAKRCGIDTDGMDFLTIAQTLDQHLGDR